MSESWEGENKTLHDIINQDDHIFISNVHQRSGLGGRPALIVSNTDYKILQAVL